MSNFNHLISANFDYKNYVISTYHGMPMKKAEYINPKLDFDSPLCIAAFINQGNNVSRRISKKELEEFVGICEASYDLLNSSDY